MALLAAPASTRRALAPALVLWFLAAPTPAAAQRRVTLQVSAPAVECEQGVCRASEEEGRLLGERVESWLRIQAAPAQPRELELSTTVLLDTVGSFAVLELHITPHGRQARASYREYDRDGEIFTADEAAGLIELPAHLLGYNEGACSCDGGRLELHLHDYGPDRLPRTEDDAYRRLSLGAISDEAGVFCRPPGPLSFDQLALSVSPIFGCLPPPPPPEPPPPDHGPEVDLTAGCWVEDPGPGPYDEYDEYDPYEEGGCGGDEPEETWDDGGCEGDTYDDGPDSAGCEGSYDDGESMDCEGGGEDYGGCAESGGGGDYGGCEGDSGAGDCAADAHAATAGPRGAGRRARRGRSLLGRHLGGTLPFVTFGLFVAFTRRRRRR